ncbi:MAG: hypothetical protein A2Z28_00065 [Chloroflexi bacterium RBG_16_51_9]|nr:MAG: hypothetical protein A2Z28_00065 [Chloroflexi bacterium RBG_16_51_9]
MKKNILVGMGAAILLFGVYFAIIILAEGLSHAIEQTTKLWYWVAVLAAGFGVQAGLFSFIRRRLRERRVSTTASVATSGGVSAGSMAACCAHHLTDVLPLLGLSSLAAFLASYQLLFIVLGVLSNLIGIVIMLETIQRHNLSRRLAERPWNMGMVRKLTIISAVLIFTITAFGTLLAT